MPRFKFQTPTGSIIMEFDDTSTVYQVRMFLSQTIERKVQGLVAVAEKGSSFHAVSRLADSQRMRDVDRKAVILLDCEKLKPEVNSPKLDTSTEQSPTSNDVLNSKWDSGDKLRETSERPNKNQQQSSRPFGKQILPEHPDEPGGKTPSSTSSKTSPNFGSSQSFGSMADWKNPSNPMLAALSLSNGTGVFGPLPFNFNPFLLIPAVLKYCIHFEIDHFNINAEIFSHATMGCTAASMEKTLSLPMGEFMDSQGKFLPIVKHFMRSEEERAEIYSTVKTELRKAASVIEQQSQQTLITSFPPRVSTIPPRLKPEDSRRVTFLSNGTERDAQISADIHRPPSLSELSFFKMASAPPPLASVQTNQSLSVPSITLPNTSTFRSQQSPDHPNSTSLTSNSVTPNSVSDPNAKRMRRRTTITRSAKIVMVEWYLSNGRYLTADGRQLLSGHLGLTEENVRVFFKNLRRLEKKCEETGTPLMDAINGVDNENSNLSEDLQLVNGSFDDDSSPTMIKLETID